MGRKHLCDIVFSVKFVTLAFFVVPLLVIETAGQLVSIGPEHASLKEYCQSVEPLRPNLVLKEDTQIFGRLTDQTKAPFQKTAIELRRFISPGKQVFLKKFSTDGEGYFDLGVIKRGNYRLLLSSSRGFKQPETLECWGKKKCTLDTVLIVNPTDLPTAPCPIR